MSTRITEDTGAPDLIDESALPHAALIFTGYSGSGKSTLIEALRGEREYHESQARYTSRPQRPGETTESGHFIDQETFDRMREQFVFAYNRYGHSYGFSGPIIESELTGANTMLIGGKEDTARALRNSLRTYLETTAERENVLPNPVLLFVHRSRARVIEGLRKRQDDPVETARRIADVEATYHEVPAILSADEVEIIDNNTDDPTVSAQRVIDVSRRMRARALQEMLGSKGTDKDFAALLEERRAIA